MILHPLNTFVIVGAFLVNALSIIQTLWPW